MALLAAVVAGRVARRQIAVRAEVADLAAVEAAPAAGALAAPAAATLAAVVVAAVLGVGAVAREVADLAADVALPRLAAGAAVARVLGAVNIFYPLINSSNFCSNFLQFFFNIFISPIKMIYPINN